MSFDIKVGFIVSSSAKNANKLWLVDPDDFSSSSIKAGFQKDPPWLLLDVHLASLS